MKDYEISTPEKLDVALGANSLRKHSQLWKAAKGRSFRWSEALGVSVAVLFLAMGIVPLTDDADAGLMFVILGVAIAGSVVFGHMQRQLSALVELLERLEHERSGVSPSA
jgi:hypothetical protein